VLAPSNTVTWTQFFEAWAVLVADFRSEYGIHLERDARDRSFTWREFAFYATGLLSQPTTRIYRRFAPRNDD
jgi:hypothetical protein